MRHLDTLIHWIERSLKRALLRSLTLRKAYFRLAGLYHRARLKKSLTLRSGFAEGAPANGVNPENVVWIFCTGRSGSTWLRRMMEELVPCKVWEEPKVGQLFGEFYDSNRGGRLSSADFVMGDPTRKAWVRALRNFVLEMAWAARPAITPRDYLFVKEPDGAVGAPLLMEALPESRMVLLVRDPRDVVASTLDASRRGNWMYELQDRGARGRQARADEKPDVFVKRRADKYVRNVGNAKRAYEAHKSPKVLVLYEELRADTLGTMKRLCSALGIPVEEAELTRAVEKHSWESIPEKEKGGGKFYRKATPGGWREDLTPEQVKTVEKITAPLLEEFYPS
jgi:hypothetical protein